MGHWTPMGIEPTDYHDDDDEKTVIAPIYLKSWQYSCLFSKTDTASQFRVKLQVQVVTVPANV